MRKFILSPPSIPPSCLLTLTFLTGSQISRRRVRSMGRSERVSDRSSDNASAGKSTVSHHCVSTLWHSFSCFHLALLCARKNDGSTIPGTPGWVYAAVCLGKTGLLRIACVHSLLVNSNRGCKRRQIFSVRSGIVASY